MSTQVGFRSQEWLRGGRGGSGTRLNRYITGRKAEGWKMGWMSTGFLKFRDLTEKSKLTVNKRSHRAGVLVDNDPIWTKLLWQAETFMEKGGRADKRKFLTFNRQTLWFIGGQNSTYGTVHLFLHLSNHVEMLFSPRPSGFIASLFSSLACRVLGKWGQKDLNR